MRAFMPTCIVLTALNVVPPVLSQEQGAKSANTAEAKPSEQANASRNERFAKMLSQVKLVGQFTVVGRDNGNPSKEEYIIQKVEKLPDGDKWMFHCRITYGNHDVALPLPIDVQWAGDTPIITLDDLTIPTLGTFSSRVVLHEGKYAGTWRHDKVGGHLFGTIEKLSDSKDTPPAK